MQPEPAELQILRQLLGHERGGDVFALSTMAGSLAQMQQQLQQQAEVIEQMKAAIPLDIPHAPSVSPWTGPDESAQEGP